MTQERAYLQGFVTKCAEYGVDPAALIKLAVDDPAFKNSRRHAYLAGIAPGAGLVHGSLTAPKGSSPEQLNDEAMKGLLAQTVGSVGGGIAGAGIGAGLGLLLSALSKGKGSILPNVIAGSKIGVLPGAYVGGSEALHATSG